ncbi:formylglycine-generating enzyme family protein [Roseovarius sp. SCSIO 43702]|uniref:formylglycine-generating enzyme family protein n=1 Tax=Roseovarius sp. SCSIO 43702 TaxID=2823043 RepID=UPI001C72D1E8|nr:SUMF1/EgtB/PvdO family nonheme iron enzyme [Roseovarius sp. SCSIO 43702]QYX56210.1 formylglycine-generating enzyme family protein [Roseovarius sp. SCSIO 43702]
MTTAAIRFRSRPVSLRPVVAGLVAALVIVGAAQMLRGPAPQMENLPEMAAKPFVLSDGRAIHVQRHEVSVAEWNICHEAGGCTLALRTRPGQDAATTPATGLSHADATEYVSWISAVTGHDFRLPTDAEWTEMASPVLPEAPDPLFTDPSLTWASSYLTEGIAPRALKPQGSFSTSSEGIADLDGSVWEWTSTCYAGEGGAADPSRCPAYFVGGEHVAAMSYLERDPARGGCAVGTPPAHLGLRLVTDDPLPR